MFMDLPVVIQFAYDFSLSMPNAIICVIMLVGGFLTASKSDKGFLWLIPLAGVLWFFYMLKGLV